MLWGLIASCLLCNRPQPADDLWWETGWETGGWWVETGTDSGCDPWISLRDEAGRSVVEVDFDQVDRPQSIALTLRNRAESCGVLQIDAIEVSGSGFSVDVDPVTELSPQESIPLTLNFDPGVAGQAEGLLTITSNDPFDGDLAVPLYAEVPALDLSVSPATLSFPDTVVGCTSGATLTLANSSDQATLLEEVSVAEPFRLESPLPLSLAPGSTSVALSFAPLDADLYSETLRLQTEVGSVSVPLQGKAELGVETEESFTADGGRDFALERVPQEDTLSVRVSGVRVETWVLDTESNTLRFDEDSVPDSGASVVVRFVPQGDCDD